MSETGENTGNPGAERKKRIRAGHKAHLTKLTTAVDTLLAAYSNAQEGELLKLKGSLERKIQVIAKLDDEILDTVEDDQIDAEIEEADRVYGVAQEKLRAIEGVLKPKQVKQEISASMSVVSGAGSTSSASTNVTGAVAAPVASVNVQHKHMKLPKYEISFDGDPKKYRTFRDLFDVAVKNRADLTNVERFTYLQSFLKGEAATAIEGLAITDGNFDDALEILENRFGNKQLIVNSHMEALVGVPGVHDADDAKALRELYDKIEIQLRSLKVLDVDPETHGLLVIPVLKRKLPSEINLLLSRKFDSSEDLWKIEDMMKELKREVEARERSSIDQRVHGGKDNDKKKPKGPTTVGGFLAAGKLSCPYCEKPHYPDKCQTVTDPRRRKEILVQKKRCFLCTKAGHSASSGCQAKRMCMKCSGRHHTSICIPKKQADGGATEENPTEETQSTVATNCDQVAIFKPKPRTVLLETACATFSNPTTERKVNGRAILDNGSQRTYCTRRLQMRLRLKVFDSETTDVGVFGGGSVGAKTYDVVMVAVQKIDGDSEVLYFRCLVTETICSPLIGQRIDAVREKYSHFNDLDLADRGSGAAVEVDMLIGGDNYWSVVTGDGNIRGQEGPVALHSKLGYVLSGTATLNPVSFLAKSEPKFTSMLASSTDEITVSLQRFWELDSIGIVENEVAVQTTPSEIRFVKGRYEVDTPWRANHEMLGDNYVQSKSRLLSNLRRYKRDDPKLLQTYANTFLEQLKDGTLERVTPDMIAPVGKTYYMPHHLVVRQDKETTKVRVVYDCSSKMAGNVSLNDCLEVPEPLYADLLAVLINFRVHKVAIIGDIEKAFLQIGMAEKDRDAYRVLFVDDPFKDDPEIVELRFTTVTFGVGPSMWHLGAVVQHLANYVEEYPDLVKKIESGLYADDYSGGDDDDEKAIAQYRQTKKIFKDANMNMRKWKSNSPAVMEVMQKEEGGDDLSEESQAKMMLNPNDPSPVKTLGVPWDLKTDKMTISLEKAISKGKVENVTKTVVLSASASIYDPAGIVGPITFWVKVLFQRVCQTKGSWDDQLDEETRKEWDRWLRSAERYSRIEFPRCYHPNLAESTCVMLIGFCDASEKGYAAVVYLRMVTTILSKENVGCSLVASKTRVAPLKKQTITRLELLGALILSRLMVRIRSILRDVKVNEEYCFTDSAVAAHWICNSTKRYKKYIDKRADKIRLMVEPEKWMHVPGKENIADLPSRGCLPEKFREHEEEWFNGKEWLKKDKDKWPVKRVSDLQLTKSNEEVLESELRKAEVSKEKVLLGTDVANIESVIDPKRYSTLTKLLRVTSICHKFIDIKLKRQKDIDKEISAEDMSRSKDLWIRHLQRLVTQEPKYEKTAESLGIKQDSNGYLRCMGRLGRGKIPFDSKHPMILPGGHWVTTLIIRACHEKVFHDKVKETLAEFRSAYWVTRGRQRVSSVLQTCRLCKILEGLNYPAPVQAELPDFRVDGGIAFKNTGVDFGGPVYTKEAEEMRKSYIVLFTCATSRMVHLELCPNLTTEAYVRSQKRMIGRRGAPVMFVSDNGRTFKGKGLKRFNAERGIRWRFNLSRAPWWGGMFERLIRSTKRCLKKAIGRRRLTYEELETVLIDVEAVLNSRPLTYLYANDTDTPITPSHLFCGRRLLDQHEDTGKDDVTIPKMNRKKVVATATKEGEAVAHF